MKCEHELIDVTLTQNTKKVVCSDCGKVLEHYKKSLKGNDEK